MDVCIGNWIAWRNTRSQRSVLNQPVRCLAAQSRQLCCDPMHCSPPGSSVHRTSQARILEGVAISVSRGSSWPRDRIPVFCISCLVGGILYHWVWVYYIMLLLSRFSCVQLCATPQTAAHQAPPSLGYSRQEHWSGLPFLSSMQESESEVAQSCPTLSDPMDCSPPGSSIPGILQARVLD